MEENRYWQIIAALYSELGHIIQKDGASWLDIPRTEHHLPRGVGLDGQRWMSTQKVIRASESKVDQKKGKTGNRYRHISHLRSATLDISLLGSTGCA